jgi:putative transcriptional regulator
MRRSCYIGISSWQIGSHTLYLLAMGIIDELKFEPDPVLRKILEEFEWKKELRAKGIDPSTVSFEPPIDRPKFSGRKTSNSLFLKRSNAKLTQADLAAKAGTTRKTIIDIEREKRVPTVYTAIMIAEALGARVEEVFHLEPISAIPPSKY